MTWNIAPPTPADGRILFHRRDREWYGFLSNFYEASFVLLGTSWPTVEHYYQAQKSLDRKYQKAIRDARTAGRAKRLGSLLGATRTAKELQFHAGLFFLRSDWESVKLDVMRSAVSAKFAQNPGLAKRLISTSPAELVEDSPYDCFWGTGADGRGENWLGRILMDLRSELDAC